MPAAILGARFGLATEPDAQKRRRIDQRSRAWIFVTPALAFIGVGLLAPLIRTIYLSFHNRNGTRVRRVGQLHGRSSPTRTR